ncbi:hypothetical protein CFC21_104105 [Triticum aestivum]|uniref:Uncharacterized protein n=2 Tax=Triticum aestivum TaxID=4565 RepID=A0A3B6SNT7_WHEAT|nr:uncharacterized protein LOC119342121 [Triticum dicoccoides]XP_044433066.1 uncharacterized protein LOC123159303 [Triticum aestivum]KAF7103076.1 hypothetical protein CFC21_104105 [Triticum aestivum]
MGSGLSHNHRSSVAPQQQPSSARVIAADGSLTEFATSSPVSVSDVLGGNADGPFFLCSSDALYFDEDVPALGGGEQLRPGQIYFVLPVAMLGRPLSSADMAAMAVRASEALATRARPRGRGAGIRKVRVTPVHPESGRGDVDAQVNAKLNERRLGEYSVKASGNPAKISKKAAVAACPPAKKPLKPLSTIKEDEE